MSGRPWRVAFLFNHEAVHQVRHTAPVAAALARHGGVAVSVLCSSAAQESEARSIIGAAAGAARDDATARGPDFELLHPGPVARALGPLLSVAGPFRRIAVLLHNRRRLARFDAIVVPETTSMLLRDVLGVDGPLLVWIPHGAGDRSVGFRRIAARFDLVLVAGDKVRERMVEDGGVDPARCRVVGYPKFDTLDPATPGPPLFANGRPTVVYNPHFDPRLSSWFELGEAVLDWFAGQDRFNLVFAPHVMLFRRRIHASVEHRLLRWRGAVAERFRHNPNMLIDTGSIRSTDMTYTRSGDIYLGDASSQIYEWIARPRPAVFLDPHKIAWEDDPNFAHWRLGAVAESIADMAGALDAAVLRPDAYARAQAAAFARTFSMDTVPAAQRAADAVVALLEGTHRAQP